MSGAHLCDIVCPSLAVEVLYCGRMSCISPDHGELDGIDVVNMGG